MANIAFTIPSVLNQSGGEMKSWVMTLSVEYWKAMELPDL
jgi:hypothetical protein